MSDESNIRKGQNPFTGKKLKIARIRYSHRVYLAVGKYVVAFNELEQYVTACLIDQLATGNNDQNIAKRIIGGMRFSNKFKHLFDILEYKCSDIKDECSKLHADLILIDQDRHKIVHGSYSIDEESKTSTLTHTKPTNSKKIADLAYSKEIKTVESISNGTKVIESAIVKLDKFYMGLHKYPEFSD